MSLRSALLAVVGLAVLASTSVVFPAARALAGGSSYIDASAYGSTYANLRPCGQVVAPGFDAGECGGVTTTMNNGTAVTMHCWTDSERPARGESPRWFYVTDVNSSPQYSGYVYSDFVKDQTSTPQCPDGNTGMPEPTYPENDVFSQYPSNPKNSSLYIGYNRTGLSVQVQNEFPTGPATVVCHTGSGYPSGGSTTTVQPVTIVLNSFEGTAGYDSWSEPVCASTGYFWISVTAQDGLTFYSNILDLGSPPAPSAPGLLGGYGDEIVDSTPYVQEPMDVTGGVENYGGSRITVAQVALVLTDPDGGFHEAVCSDPRLGPLTDITLDPGQDAACTADFTPTIAGTWTYEIEYQDHTGSWHEGELYKATTAELAANPIGALQSTYGYYVSPMSYTDEPIFLGVGMTNPTASDLSLAQMNWRVVGPDGQQREIPCSDDTLGTLENVTLSPGQNFECDAWFTPKQAGTWYYTWDYEDSIGTSIIGYPAKLTSVEVDQPDLAQVGNIHLTKTHRGSKTVLTFGATVANRGAVNIELEQLAVGVRDRHGKLHDQICAPPKGKPTYLWIDTKKSVECTASFVASSGGTLRYQLEYEDLAYRWQRGELGPAQSTTLPTTAPSTCPQGATAKHRVKGRIEDVRVTPVDSKTVCLRWLNPHDPSVGGFAVSTYPENAHTKKAASGAPYPKASMSSLRLSTYGFLKQFKPTPGERWKVCVEPMGHGTTSGGQYKLMDKRQGCSKTFTWP